MYQNFIPYSPSYFAPGSRFMTPQSDELQLVRAYIVDQPYIGLFPLSDGLRKGTIFPNLYKPYPGK